MDVHQAIELVEGSDAFRSFIEQHDHYYLVHGFCTIENGKRSAWQVGYYSKRSERIVSFIAGETVSRGEEDEAFIKQGHVPPLQEGEVKASLDEALAKAEDFRKEGHSGELLTKTIVILQTIDDNPVWNLTLVTHAFSLLNIRVHAGNGVIISTTADSVLNLGRRT